MFNRSNLRSNKPTTSYAALHVFKKAKSPNKENMKNKENLNNPKQGFKLSVNGSDPVKEVSRFGIKENINEVYPKKNLVKGTFFCDNRQYLSTGIDEILLRMNLEEEPDKDYNSFKLGNSSIYNINSNYFSKK